MASAACKWEGARTLRADVAPAYAGLLTSCRQVSGSYLACNEELPFSTFAAVSLRVE